jgi:uncharacterized protein DUF29
MPITESPPLAVLFEQDETAWLEAMANLAADGRHAEMDFVNLSEYLADMAKRDRREVASRLVTLLAHLLKWQHQPDRRSGSWEKTILEQRRELRELLESGTLHNHAAAILAKSYAGACKEVAAETGLPRSTFAPECSWDLESLLADEDEAAE